MSAGRCRDCQAEFAEPSFSEGPKTTDPATGIESVRFAQAWFMCPERFSTNIEPSP